MKRKFVYYIDGGYCTKLYADSTMTLYIKDIYGDVYTNKNGLWELTEDEK